VVNLFLNGWVETVRFHMPLGSVEGEAHNLLRRVGELDFTSVRLTDTELVIVAAEFPVGAEGSRLARVRVHPLDSDLFQALAQGTRAAPPPPALLPAQQPDVHRHYSDLTPDRLARLVWAGRLNGVLSLHLRGSSLGDEGISVLAADETLGLRELDLWGAGVGPAGAAAIAAAPWFPALSELRVGGSPLVNAGVAALGEPAAPCWLTRLGLDEVGVGDAGMVRLARSARFSALEAIDLQGNEVTEVGAAALLGSAHFPALRRLELAYNPIDARRRADLVLTAADRPHLEVFFGSSYSERPIVRAVERGPTGEVVRFTIPRSDPGVIDGLADSPALGTITALTIHDTQIAPDAAGRIAAGLSPARWQELDLTGCSLGETPGAVVERFCSGHRLAQLTLAGIGLKYSAAFKLALCPALAGVRTLDLSNNPLGTGGLEALLGSPHLSGVERIVLKGLNLSQRERAHYQKQFGRRAEF
ncbi:MAG TPA: hypothetical protein VKE74_24820, partial [Gemmataceae bacterium]|nr:hypothetical protein [Gemmataceae bacterium]